MTSIKMMPSNTSKIKFLVGLDLTEMDNVTIKYVSFLTSILPVEKIYFIHNIKQIDIMDILEEYMDKHSLEEIINKELNESIKQHYSSPTPFELLVSEDNYTESLITYIANKYQINWVLLGLKDEMQGTGGLTHKLVRMLPCSLMLIPEKATLALNKLLIPTDFTAPTSKAFQAAIQVAKATQCSIDVLHVFNIPSFFFPYIDNKKAIDKTFIHSTERYAQLIKKNKIDHPMAFNAVYQDQSTVVDIINHAVDNKNIDLVVLSARGGNKIMSLFIGSTTQSLILKNINAVLLIVK